MLSTSFPTLEYYLEQSLLNANLVCIFLQCMGLPMFAVFASTHLFSLTGGWQSASSREQAFLTTGFSLGLGGFIILQAAEPAIDM